MLGAAAGAVACGEEFEPSSGGGTGGTDGGAGTVGSSAGGVGGGGTGGSSTGGVGGGGTGGSSAGGTGGSPAGGASGSGGSGGAPECTTDSEGDDGKACTGKETCSGGKCQAGTPVTCNNPDPANCTAGCKEPGGTCAVTGNDADGDQHKANCAADPGDDCDDTNPSTYAGATELCDGKDNNCNGKDDLQDGLTLSGVTKKLVGEAGKDHYSPEIAWCPGGSKFVMVWTDTREGSPRIYAASVTPSGVVGLQKNVSGTVAGEAVEPRIACHGSECAVVWRQTELPIDVFFQRLDCDAAMVGAKVNVSETPGGLNLSPSVVRFGNDWIVSFLEKDAMGQPAAYRVVGADGTLKTSTQFVSESTGLRYQIVSAATTTHVGFAWELTNNVVEWARIDSALTLSSTQALSPKPAPTGQVSKDAAIATHLGNLAIAWRTSTASSAKIEYVERTGGGSTVCTAASLASYPEMYVMGVASHKDGALVAALTGASNIFDIKLVRAKNCTKLDELTIGSQTFGTGIGVRTGSIAGGAGGYAVVWAAAQSIYGRFVGPNLCD